MGIGATSYVPARGTLEDRVGDVSRRANAPKHVLELVAQPQQGLHGQVVSPTQAQVLHHFREPDSMRVARGHGSSSYDWSPGIPSRWRPSQIGVYRGVTRAGPRPSDSPSLIRWVLFGALCARQKGNNRFHELVWGFNERDVANTFQHTQRRCGCMLREPLHMGTIRVMATNDEQHRDIQFPDAVAKVVRGQLTKNAALYGSWLKSIVSNSGQCLSSPAKKFGHTSRKYCGQTVCGEVLR